MDSTAEMSPEASPQRPAETTGVRRVNNLPVYIAGGVIFVFLLIMVLVATERAAKQSKKPEHKLERAGDTAMFASAIAGSQHDGIIPPSKPPLLPLENAPLSVPTPSAPSAPLHPEGNDLPPLPPRSSAPAISPETEIRNRMRQEKTHMFEQAAKAGTLVAAAAPRSPASAPATNARLDTVAYRRGKQDDTSMTADQASSEDPMVAYNVKLQQLRQAGLLSPAPESIPSSEYEPSGKSSAAGKDYAQFGHSLTHDRWQLDNQTQPPRSPYELRAGFVLPAILISGINSDLPGQVIGQVSQDVYDTATGKWKLVPQGSRLVGQYSSEVAYGQARILVAWQRIIFPDGKALDIGAMPGADGAGYAGFNDQVNNHYVRVFGSALLMSAVVAGVAISQPEYQYGNRLGAREAMSEALGQQLGRVTAQLIARNLGIAPTLEIRPGYRFNVVVTKDLTFSKPYQAFDY